MNYKFTSVNIVATKNAHDTFTFDEILHCLSRHFSGDWGDLVRDDKKANERALKTGGRILSSYKFSNGRKLWIITDAADDEGVRHCTTCLLPSDY